MYLYTLEHRLEAIPVSFWSARVVFQSCRHSPPQFSKNHVDLAESSDNTGSQFGSHRYQSKNTIFLPNWERSLSKQKTNYFYQESGSQIGRHVLLSGVRLPNGIQDLHYHFFTSSRYGVRGTERPFGSDTGYGVRN